MGTDSPFRLPRGVAVVLMVTGIALFGVLTATVAAYFVERDDERDQTLREILERLETIETLVHARKVEASDHGGCKRS
jgi:hypothetical protein